MPKVNKAGTPSNPSKISKQPASVPKAKRALKPLVASIGTSKSARDISDHKPAQQKISESGGWLRFVLDSAPQKIFTANPDGSVDYFSPQWFEFTGLSFEQIRDWGWTQIIHPDDLEENVRVWRQAIDTGEAFEFEHRFRRADGKYRWHVSRAVAHRDDKGGVLKWVGSNTDIQDIKEANQALRTSEERFRTMFEAAPMAVFVCDRNAIIQLYNRVAAELWGREPVCNVEQHCGSVGLWLPDGSPLPHAQSPVVEVLRTGIPARDIEILIERPDGSRLPVLVNFSALRDAQGEITGAITSFVDITARKRVEQALLDRESEFRALADNMSQLAWMADAQGWIYWYNKRWFDYTGTTLEEMQGWGWREVHHPDHVERVIQEVQRNWSAGKTWEGTYLLRSAKGEWRWFLTRAEPIRNESGKLLHWFGTNTDITERLKAEAQRTLLINELNHRVKNTLATVQALARQTILNQEANADAGQSFEARLAALSQAHDMLTTESWQSASLREVVHRALEPFQTAEKRVEVEGPDVRLSPKQALALSMALHELATNASKYGALSIDRGRVRVIWSISPLDGMGELQLTWAEEGGPPVAPPKRKGFGSRLIERSLAHDLGGDARIEYRPEGVLAIIRSPLESVGGGDMIFHQPMR